MTDGSVFGSSCRRGTVVFAKGARCTVEFPAQRCSDCSGHCALSVFGPDAVRLTMRMRDLHPMPALGAEVWVAVPERAILRGALGVFGLPLLGLVVGSGVADVLGMAAAPSAWSAAVSLMAGILAGALAVRRGAATEALLHDGYAERAVTLLNQAASMRSDARSVLFNTGKSRIT